VNSPSFKGGGLPHPAHSSEWFTSVKALPRLDKTSRLSDSYITPKEFFQKNDRNRVKA
jgi:hypothetical protein